MADEQRGSRATAFAERILRSGQRRLPRRVSIRWLDAKLTRQQPDVVLVDYFGTIVTRAVPPWYVKLMASRRLVEDLCLDLSPSDVYRARAEIERSMSRDGSALGVRAYSVESVARACAPRLIDARRSGTSPLTEQHLVARFVAADVDAELMVQAVDRTLLSVLEKHAGRRRLVVVSDFDIGNPHFAGFLEQQGIERLFERTFVSCDYGATKRSGALFDIVMSELGCRPSEALVVGDHPVADGLRPRAVGCRTHLVRPGRWEQHKKATSLEVAKDVEKRVDRLLRRTDRDDLFPAMALTLYTFVRRLHDTLHESGVSEAVFLAREGKFLSRLFSAYEEEARVPTSSRVRARYLLVSRRSTYLPSLPSLRHADFKAFFERFRQPTLGELLAALGFGEEVFTRLASALGGALGASAPLDLEAVRSDSGFQDEYESRRTEQRALLREYLDEALDLSSRRPLHLVDVGWRGGMQDNLARLIPADGPRLYGSYVGLVSTGDLENADAKTGVLFHNRPRRSAHLEVFTYFKSLFEVLLSAEDGSVNGYEHRHGRAVAIQDNIPEERDNHARFVAPIQERIDQRFRRLCRELARSPIDDDGLLDLTARHHAAMVYRPSLPELRLFDDFRFFDAGRVQQESVGRGPKRVSGQPDAPRARSPLGLVRGGGWPPLRLRASHLGLLRFPYGWYKIWTQRHRTR